MSRETTTFVEVTVVLDRSLAVRDVVQVSVENAVSTSVTSHTNGLSKLRVGSKDVNVTLPELQRVNVRVVRDPAGMVIVV